jgi:uncharacterized surface protein with fasciclin (FAS1) repeats
MPTIKTIATGVALVSALSMTAACGSSGSSSSGAASGGSGTNGNSSSSGGSGGGSASGAMADLVGSGCAGYAKAVPTGSGSVQGMAQDPVATAASNNPLLKTLVAAVSGQLNPKVNLVNTLNNGKFTVFAPVDDAFKQLPKQTVKQLEQPKNAAMLTKILTYHVVPGQLSPMQVDGTHKTAEGGSVKVTGSGNNIKVDGAHVICGGVKTANATVYLIDKVLSPQM